MGSFATMDLLIGIVMNSMANMHDELDNQKTAARSSFKSGSSFSVVTTVEHYISALKTQLDALRANLS